MLPNYNSILFKHNDNNVNDISYDITCDQYGNVNTTVTTVISGYPDDGLTSICVRPTIQNIKQTYSPEEIIDAYGVEVFENIIRKKKLERLNK